MPIPLTCPNCQRTALLPDRLLGRKVKCPACGTISTAESIAPQRSSAAPVHPADDEVKRFPPNPARPRGRGPASRPYVLGAMALGAVLLATGAWILGNRPGGTADQPTVAHQPPADPPTEEPTPVEPAPAPPPAATGPAPAFVPTAAAPASIEPAVPPDPSRRPETAAEVIRRVRDATVYVKVRTRRGDTSGSGFVIQTDGDAALIATNHHVVYPASDDQRGTSLDPESIAVVFRSGTGPAEQSRPAALVASERQGSRDLAILRVTGVKDLPRPIALSREADHLVETMPVLIYGFPFGDIDRLLDTGGGNPAITINRGSISSLRRNAAGEVAYVQIDGSLNPGNSGGPVVDEQGRLVGVAVAQLRSTTIGFAIPTAELRRMLDGKLGPVDLELQADPAGAAALAIRVHLIDPLRQIRAVDLAWIPAAGLPNPRPAADGSWPPLTAAQPVALTLDPAAGIAAGRFRADLAAHDRSLLIQASYRTAAGTTVYTEPRRFAVPTNPGVVRAEGDPRPESSLAFSKLGALIDEDQDCTATQDAQGLTIHVPAGIHILSPARKQHNAPRVLAEVAGDFVAAVRIAGDLQPGAEPPSKRIPFTFQGAGLLLWQDERNYLRLERTVGTTGGIAQVTRFLVEICQDGRLAYTAYPDVPPGPISVGLVREAGVLQFLISPDGRQWGVSQKLAVEFGDRLSIGLSASNASKKPLAARFEEFVLARRLDMGAAPGEDGGPGPP